MGETGGGDMLDGQVGGTGEETGGGTLWVDSWRGQVEGTDRQTGGGDRCMRE